MEQPPPFAGPPIDCINNHVTNGPILIIDQEVEHLITAARSGVLSVDSDTDQELNSRIRFRHQARRDQFRVGNVRTAKLARWYSQQSLRVLHTAKILRLSEDLPMVVEIADSLEKIEHFLPKLDQMIKDGLVTLEQVRVIHYKA